MATQDMKDFLVETHSIDYIPSHLRHGKSSDLFTLWFGANTMVVTITTGALAIVQGFSLLWAGVGLVFGVLIGGIFMAYHSAQGPHLGLPQMIQSRAQFGFYGASLPLLLVIAMYLGFFAAGGVLGGEAVAVLFHTSVSLGIIVMSAANLLLALFGYNLIHRFERYISYFFAAVFLVITGIVIFGHPFAHPHPGGGGFLLGPFLLTVATAAIYEITYAPYVADYSRYLPESTSIREAFWYTYGGSVISGIWMMVLGAALQSLSPSSDPVTQIASVAGSIGLWFRVITLLAIALGIVSINSLNIYGGYMSSLTILSAFFRRWTINLALRVWFIVPVTIVGTYLAFLYKINLLTSYENFLFFLLYSMIPWTAINLADYYLLRHGRYAVDDIFRPDSPYGRVNGIGILAYCVGFVVQISFMNSAIYEGPVAKMLGGGDISWIVGVMVSAALYLLLMRNRLSRTLSSENPTMAQGG